LPDTNKLRGRVPVPLREDVGREPLPQCSTGFGGKAGLVKEDKQ
jgi:hypothetical protein